MYYWINKEKILKYGERERGVIIKIKGYRYDEDNTPHSYRLVVKFNDEKIESLFFLENPYDLYSVGDEIDVIIYNRRKFVELHYME